MSKSSTSGEISLSTCEFCGTIFNTPNEKEEHIKLKHLEDKSQRS